MPENTAVRKRQQIESTNRTMFIWVAAAAAIVGVALVLCVSLTQRLVFNQKVIGEKIQTVSNLQHNNETVSDLRDNSRVLNTNSALLDTPRPTGAEPISVVLDALPSQANSSALGASLQKKLLTGVSVDSLTVEPVADEQSGDGSTSSSSSSSSSNSSDSTEGQINFTFTVSSDNPDDIKKVLRNLELSIRTIKVDYLTIEKRTSGYSLSVRGVAYYSPEVKVELGEKKVRP